jgi:hypothetical protein
MSAAIAIAVRSNVKMRSAVSGVSRMLHTYNRLHATNNQSVNVIFFTIWCILEGRRGGFHPRPAIIWILTAASFS